ncbi:MAG TPA: zf-HC2 domain-containing protein [Phycisphaerae bacterium]|nr:zf-HC2 domain-containing protein [Phycisphaerae bacterium]
MDCHDVEHLLDAYLDAELPTSLQAEVHAHLLECVLCRQRVGLLRAVGDVVRSDADHPSPSPDFTDRVVQAVAERSPMRPRKLRYKRYKRVVLLTATVTAMAAALLLVVNAIGPETSRDQKLLADHQGLPRALADARDHTNQTWQQLHSSVAGLGQLGQQALSEANLTLLSDWAEVSGAPQTMPAGLPFMGQLLIPLTDVLELDFGDDWSDIPSELAEEDLDLI